MTIYKAILKILRVNKGGLFIGIIVMGIITLFYARQLVSNTGGLVGDKISILSEEDSDITKSLIRYLDRQHDIVNLKDTTTKGLDDALYFKEVNYILRIPKNFSEELIEGEKAKVFAKSRPDSFSKSLVNTTINNFLNTYLSYQRQLPNKNQKEILELTNKTLESDSKIHFDKSYTTRKKQVVTGEIFNLLAFGMFFTIFSGYAAVNLVFNRNEIKQRNNCSPISRRKLSRNISKANLFYSLFCWIVFVAFIMVISRPNSSTAQMYFLINSLMFLVTVISFSIMITNIIKNTEAITGVKSIYIMGSCFISGIFVPREIIPNVVNSIAALTPTYWFAQTNKLISNTSTFDEVFLKDFLFYSGILLLFSIGFWIIHHILIKSKNFVLEI